MDPLPSNPTWSPARKLAFRFVFAYLVLFNVPLPLSAVPGLGALAELVDSVWTAFVPWFGEKALGLEINVLPSGSGDTTFNWVQVLSILVLALLATLLWSLLDRRREDYRRLELWLRVYVRYALAVIVIGYGAVKVIKSQFPDPTLYRLVQPFGEASPMGLLWTFMGLSPGYNLFSGLGEVVGGLLLGARRTTTLGALVLVGVMSHVLVLNLCYDVPVKLYSFHLLLMALWLAAPDAGRLADFFVRRRPTLPPALEPLFARAAFERAAKAVALLFLATVTVEAHRRAHTMRTTYGDLAPKPALYGIWTVEEMTIDGELRPPLLTDGQRWRRVVFNDPRYTGIQTMNDAVIRYVTETPEDQRLLTLTRRDDPAWKASLAYERPAADRLVLTGTFEGRQVHAKLALEPAKDFLLLQRGFHWVNEFPFNR